MADGVPTPAAAAAAPLRILVVGGIAGGATFAARMRRLDEAAHITIFEKGPDVSAATCGFPYFLNGEVDKLVLSSPSALAAQIAVTIKTQHEVVAVDPARKVIRVRLLNADGTPTPGAEEQEHGYDKLLLSTGAAPLRPAIPGVDLPHVYVLRSVADAQAIKARIDTLLAHRATATATAAAAAAAAAVDASNGGGGGGSNVPPVRALVLGAGYIGLECVESLVHRGVRTTLVEFRDHVLPLLDATMTTPLLTELRNAGVQVHLGVAATGIARASAADGAGAGAEGESLEVTLSNGATIPADLVLMGVGIRPLSDLAAAAGLTLEPRSKAIAVDAHMRTSDPHIYAVGDAVAAPSLLDPSQRTWVALGGPANRQARLVADHIAFGDKADSYRGTAGTSIVRVFGASAGMVGLTESRAQALGLPYKTVTVSGPAHASYYGNPRSIALKAVYEPGSLRILGVQAVGGVEGVDKRLDVVAGLMLVGGKMDDLAHLELSYAPPFGSARDVLNTLGFAAQNIEAGLLIPVTDPTKLPPGTVVVDVRPPEAAASKPAASVLPPGTKVINIPNGKLRAEMGKLDKSEKYSTFCMIGRTSYIAGRTLAGGGIAASSILGGYTLLQPPPANK